MFYFTYLVIVMHPSYIYLNSNNYETCVINNVINITGVLL